MSASAETRRSWAAAAGLFAGPAAWMANTTLNYAVVTNACDSALAVVLVSAAMLAVAVAGGVLSWSEWRAVPAGRQQHGGAPDRLLAACGVLASGLFGLVILLQGAAGLVFTGCEG